MTFTAKAYFDKSDAQYDRSWHTKSLLTKKLTNRKCVLCDCESTETHHAVYQDYLGSISGREEPGVHIFPLCQTCHIEAHSKENWEQSKGERWGKNTIEFIKRLKAGWELKQDIRYRILGSTKFLRR